MTDDVKDPREVVADVLYDHFGDCNMSWKTHLEQADEILNSIHYHELIDLIMQNDKEIANLKEELEKKAETIGDLNRDNKYFRKELGFWKSYVTGDEHDYEYDSLA